MSSEADIVARFKSWVESQDHPDWKLQVAIPVGELIADGRIVEVNSENSVIKSIVCYVEAKGDDADLRDMMTGLGQCAYYAERTGCPSWLVLPHAQTERLLSSEKKIDPRISIFDVTSQKPICTEEISTRMSKSRLKRKQESSMFTSWEKEFTIVTRTPIAIQTIEVDAEGLVSLNIGQRVRGLLKLAAQTISGTLAESVKYSIYVEPLDIKVGKKEELRFVQKYVAAMGGRSSKREFYEIPAPRTITFQVRSINPRLTPEIVENLIRQGGMFCGIGDSHTDGYHGRFELQ